jgi:hypothetical protein
VSGTAIALHFPAFLMEAFMIRMRSLALPMMWTLALVILSGCAMDQMSNIPANATLGSSGDGRISYTSPSDGTIWVYDVTHDRIDYSGAISMNQSVAVDPGDKTVTVGGRDVMDKVSPGATHRIYFVAVGGAQ